MDVATCVGGEVQREHQRQQPAHEAHVEERTRLEHAGCDPQAPRDQQNGAQNVPQGIQVHYGGKTLQMHE
eukprot:scaffold145188_cov24-Prasinocladus_malaysianus.AAC.1